MKEQRVASAHDMSLCQWPTEETTTTATEADDMTNTKGLGTEKGNDDDEDDDDDDKGGGGHFSR